MASTSQQPKGREGVLSTLNVLIQVLDIAKDACGIPPAQIAFGSASVLLTTIRDTMANDQDYFELGRACGKVCQVLYRRLKGRQLDQLNLAVLDAIGDLTTTVAEIERKVAKEGKRVAVIRFILAGGNKDKIAGWKQDFERVLHVFNTELAIDTNMVVADTRVLVEDTHRIVANMQRNALAGQGDVSCQNHSAQASIPLGESPPPAPRDCFGRDEFIENIIGLAENVQPIALIGAGGIGKTSIALTVLHHDRIKKRFGENRRFIRCDQFPASPTNFLGRLSKVIGAGVENPEDMTPLRPLLSSKEMLIILDNAESILDPKGPSAKEIYSMVYELCQFETICLLITSRITTVPPRCKRPEIPALSMEAACDIFYGIYGGDGRSSIINDLLRRLDYHALSITLLATTASHNAWGYDRLVKEWDAQRARVLQTYYNESLAATIELSLASPTFLSLGPNARDLLGVIAFFPQGIDENNLDWLFPAIPNRKSIFDQFCVLSLTHRSNGFVTMLAPIRDYLGPQDPQSSPLLCATRDLYFRRLSVDVDPDKPGFGETRWIVLEDVNVEHLLDVFTSINPSTPDNWDACYHFMEHLEWHNLRQTILGSKIEALPDDHHYKPKCLFRLSQLFKKVGNHSEQKRLLTDTLRLGRQRGDDSQVTQALLFLSEVNVVLKLFKEGIQQAKEALEIYERTGNADGQMHCLKILGYLLYYDQQLDAAEDAASRAIALASEQGQEYTLSQLHQVLGQIYWSKGEKRKAIRHFETTIRIASPPNWHDTLFWTHYALAELFTNDNEFNDANIHIEQAKSFCVDGGYHMGRATEFQANVWYRQRRLEDAKLEALRALDIYEKHGAANDVEDCRNLLQMIKIQGAMGPAKGPTY